MRVIGVCYLTTLMAVSLWAGAASRVRLELGGNTTLHVGQIAVLEMPSSDKYIVALDGGNALVPLKGADGHRAARYLYRAARPGHATLLITPAPLKQGDCVDCITRHCFVTVVR